MIRNILRVPVPWNALLLLKPKSRPTDRITVSGPTTSDTLEAKLMSFSPKAAAVREVLATQPAYALLPGEHSDIRVDVRAIIPNADQWLVTPNTALGGSTPNEYIGTSSEQLVRDILRSAIYSGMA